MALLNRLVLIGNGFDLAHGLKTAYTDFLLCYLKRSFTYAGKDQEL
ncbi:AbiH family protein [Pedobacter namyangjuensis]